MRARGQIASLDLMLSVVVFILFLALIVGSILVSPSPEPFIYGEAITDRLTIVEDHVLNETAWNGLDEDTYNETIFTGTKYPISTPYCITIGRPVDAAKGTACVESPPSFDFDTCNSRIEQHATHVLYDNEIKQLTVWVCT